jgi:hypothetical protein
MTAKEELVAALARSRSALAQDVRSLRAEVDVPAKVNRVVRRHPAIWLGGAAALGWILAGPKTRTRTVVKRSGRSGGGRSEAPVEKAAKRTGFLALLFALVRVLFPIFKPTLSALAARALADYAGRFAR